MPESSPYLPDRSPEQFATVRRRSVIFSWCGLLCGLAGIGLLLARTIDVEKPPAIFAVNLSFCAMLMGIGILFYARGTPRTQGVVVVSLLALAAGLAGPLVFAKQSMDWHLRVEAKELANTAQLAKGSLAYARRHGGEYPPDLITLLLSKQIVLADLHSPFGNVKRHSDLLAVETELSMLNFLDQVDAQSGGSGGSIAGVRDAVFLRVAKDVDAVSDYQYFGRGLRLPVDPRGGQKSWTTRFGPLPEEIIVATSRDAIMSKEISVVFVNGRSEFLDLGGWKTAFAASNDARLSLHFGAAAAPETIQRGEAAERRDFSPGK